MDSFCLQMLALEVLQSHGGYYVPLTTIFTGDENDVETSNAIFGSSTALQFGNGSIIGYPPGMCLEKIKECYDNGKVRYDVKTRLPKNVVSDMGFGDEVAAFAHFKSGSRFLGAGEMYDASDIEANSKLESAANAALIWAYDCQVPIFRYPSEQQVTSAIRTSKKRVVVITDDQIGLYPSLMNVLPGVMYRLDNELGQDWDFIVFNIEWEVDEEELAVYKACSPFKAPTARYLGFIANTEASQFIKSLSIENVLEQHGSGRVFVASEKSKHSAKLSSMLKSMPSIERAFQSLAGFTPSFERDDMEVQDNLLKGFRDGQIAFELQVDDEQRIMFRSWYDGGINCECKILSGINGLSVEWLRYYEDHQLAYETSGTFVR